MTPGEIITRLLLAGGQVSVVFEDGGERLGLKPTEAVTPELVDMVRQHKAAIIAWLTAPTLPPTPVVDDWPPEGVPTSEQWKAHWEACFQEQMAAMLTRANRRTGKDPPGWPPPNGGWQT
jgi:hypothetical protein